ncbi:MAG: HVA22/TB2/DP1 family protein [Flavobacteriales bacterium]|nr:HVA22/TB2/DP1 family protein [Flavobacteriales bacterium]
MTYWIVFAFVTVFDGILSTILFFLPAYYAFKLLFIIWLFYPRTDGASLIYERFLRPNLAQVKTALKNMSAK